MEAKISFNKFQGELVYIEISELDILLRINKKSEEIIEISTLPEGRDESYAGNYIAPELIKAALKKTAEIVVEKINSGDQEYSYYCGSWYKRSYFGEIYLDTSLGKLFDKLPEDVFENKYLYSDYVGEYRANSYYKPVIKDKNRLAEAIFVWLLLNIEVKDYRNNIVF